MAGKQAKILNDAHVQDLLAYASSSRHPLRNSVIVLLSTKAGLRAGEISGLTWEMVLGADASVSSTVELYDAAAKNGSGRRIPIHADLKALLVTWQEQSQNTGPVITSLH